MKSVRIQSFSGPYFSAFWTADFVSLRIQSECRKKRTSKTPNTVTFHAMRRKFVSENFLTLTSMLFSFPVAYI